MVVGEGGRNESCWFVLVVCCFHFDAGVPATEVRFLLGTALARMDKKDEAQQVLKQVAASNTRYVGPAKGYLNALESGSQLPPMPGNRPARASARSAAPAPAAATP